MWNRDAKPTTRRCPCFGAIHRRTQPRTRSVVWSTSCDSVQENDEALVPYLEKPEMDALLSSPCRQTAQGRRDYALLLFLYNSGSRADEAAQLLISDLDLGASCVKIRGKGGKQRLCPL